MRSDFEKVGGTMTLKCLQSAALAVIHHLPYILSIYNTLYVPEYRIILLALP
jgi:hypothetical protein